jgi:hypothetical protein
MNKKIVGLVLILIILCAVGVGVYYLLAPSYKEFSDEKIQVEIPNDINFTVNNTQDGVGNISWYYDVSEFNVTDISIFDIINSMINPSEIIMKPVTSIQLISINFNLDYSKDMYGFLKENYFENFPQSYTILNESEHNYNGTIYNVTDLGPSTYYIFINNDESRTIAMLISTDLDTVIHMAETFKFK